MDLPADLPRRAILIAAAIALTAAAYFVSFGLHPVWWLPWLAPLPVLLLASRLRAWQALATAFTARAIAGMNLWHYIHGIVQVPLGVAIAALLIPAACFSLAVMLHRGLLRKGRPWLAALAFPVTITGAEYLLSLSQGTFGNTGYTQMKNLPVLQLAAIAGLWGISFTFNLLPAAVAALVSTPAKARLRIATAFAAFYVCVLTYGILRLNMVPQAPHSVLVGLVETHAGADMFPPDAPSTMTLMQGYALQIKSLAAQGAGFVVLPEMTALIPDSASAAVDAFFQQTAHDDHVQVLLRVLHVTDHGAYNEGRLYSATGNIETVYRKHHLVPTWEARSTPGSDISVLAQQEGKIGIEICRDMDYPELARRYAHQQVGLVLVPGGIRASMRCGTGTWP